ncbi:VWA domain-containing protein [Agrococcus versicolor]|uniref:VWA domain-containing protein n=1 Tax=Agrococcus versicolor TaxID=501482 RepID=A0ABN3ATC9_9MICO
MTFLPDIPVAVLAIVGIALVGLCAWRLVAERGRRIHWIRRTLMAVLIVAMVARPGVPGGEVPTGSIDVDIFLVIDTSQSIAAEDWGQGEPRIEGIRDDVRDVAYAFAGSNISVITFDSEPELRVPLTDDGSAVIELVNALRPEIGFFSQGSSISAARDTLQQEIERAEAANPGSPTLVFYMGDGEQTAEAPPQSFDTVAPLVDAGFVLGYGTEQGGRMQESSFEQPTEPVYVQDPAGGDAVSRIDEGALEDIASQLGVSYLHRSADVALAPSLEAMTSQQGEVDLSEYEEARLDLYWVLAVPLFLLLAWELFVFASALRLRSGAGRR